MLPANGLGVASRAGQTSEKFREREELTGGGCRRRSVGGGTRGESGCPRTDARREQRTTLGAVIALSAWVGDGASGAAAPVDAYMLRREL